MDMTRLQHTSCMLGIPVTTTLLTPVTSWCCRSLSCDLQGFAVQSYVTGEGPYANWSKHVADPFGYNLLTVLGAEERIPTL